MKIEKLEEKLMLNDELEVIINSPKIGEFDSIAVICHPHPLYGGTMDNKVVYALKRAFNLVDIPVIRFNFRGVGKSAGIFDNGDGETQDLETILNFITKSSNKKMKLYLAGFSFGGFVVANLTENFAKYQNNFDLIKVVLIAPAVNLKYYKNFPKLEKNTTNIAIILGNDDNLVPPNEVECYYNEISDKKGIFEVSLIKIDGAGHFFDGKLVELNENLVNILR